MLQSINSSPFSKQTLSTQQTPQKQSDYDYPDIRKSKYFKLSDLQRLNQLYQRDIQDLQRQDHFRQMQEQQDGVMDSHIWSQGNSVKYSSLQEKKIRTGFMFDCFNVFKKVPKMSQNVLPHGLSLSSSSNFLQPYQEESSFKNKSRFFQLSNSISNPQILLKQSKLVKDIQLTEYQMHQQNQRRLEFKLQLRKPEFCMGAFTHTQSMLFNGIDLNISIPSVNQHKPFLNLINSKVNSFSNLLNSKVNSFMGNKSLTMEDIAFNNIKETQSKYFGNIPKINFLEGIDIEKDQEEEKLINKQKEKERVDKDLYGLSCIEPQYLKRKNQLEQNLQRAYQMGLIQLQHQQISVIQTKENQEQDNLSRSIFQNYQLWQQTPQYNQLPIWQSRVTQYNINQNHSTTYNHSTIYNPTINNLQPTNQLISAFQVSYQWHQHQLSLLQSQFTIQKDAPFMIDDRKLFVLIGEMLQGVQNNLFLLDYDRMQWYVDLRGFRFQHTLRGSFMEVIKDVLLLANMRSRLDKTVEYMKLRPYRRLYYEIAKVTATTLKVLEEFVLQFIQNSCKYDHERPGLIEFLINVEELVPEVRMLYQLIISQRQVLREGLSYFNFDHRFLNSEFQLFEQILRLSREVDQTNSSLSQLAKNLLQASFKPIISSLNRILFEQMTSISPKDDIYLKYYYQSTKELFNQVSRRMEIVHRQSPQLYILCKQKLQIRIEFSIDELRRYDEQWSKLFYYKFTHLQQILTQMINNQHQALNIVNKQKETELIKLKQKLLQKTEKEKFLKKSEKDKKDNELIRLRKEIKEKEQRRKLEQLIRKQKERGFLLQDQLDKKIGLVKEKEKLLNSGRQNGEKQKQIISQPIEQQQINVKKWKEIKDQTIVEGKQLLVKDQGNRKILQVGNQMISQLILPIVNESIIEQKDNQIEQLKAPDSPKSSRSRKIRKQGRDKSVRRKREGLGKIYFHKRLHIQTVPSSQQTPQTAIITFRELCQRVKKLNFTPNQSQQQLIQRRESQSDSQISSLSDEQQMQLQLQHIQRPFNTTISPTREYTPTNCIFQTCIDKVLSTQTAVINNCFQILIFQKYHFKKIMQFMKQVFLSENGQNHLSLLSLSCNSRTSSMSLKCFSQCFLFDNLPQHLQQLKPSFYNTRQQSLQQIQQRLLRYSSGSVDAYYGQFNIIGENLQEYIGFQFMSLPNILQSYFSYIHMSKYMQIFSFLLRIKHCQMLISESWILLNQYKKELFRKQRQSKKSSEYQPYPHIDFHYESKLLNQLFVTRHIIQSFLKTYQNYIFFRVIQKEYKTLNKKIQKQELHDLENSHLKLLDTIIRFAFVDNSTNNITREIRRLLEFIREFRNIVDLICADDVLQEQKGEIRHKVKFINTHFRRNQKFFETLYFKS